MPNEQTQEALRQEPLGKMPTVDALLQSLADCLIEEGRVRERARYDAMIERMSNLIRCGGKLGLTQSQKRILLEALEDGK